MDFLDLGFDWNDKTIDGVAPTDPAKPCTMSYGFGGDDGAGQEDYQAKVENNFAFTVFELSNTDGVSLDKVEIVFAPVAPTTRANPFDGFAGTYQGLGTGQKNGRSAGLNATGTGWSPGGTAVLKYEGTWHITVNVQASKGGSARYWSVDPELIVGSKGGGRG